MDVKKECLAFDACYNYYEHIRYAVALVLLNETIVGDYLIFPGDRHQMT